MPRRHVQQICEVYVSHSAPKERYARLDWFIVKPGPGGTVDEEVQHLLDAGRTVYRINAKPKLTQRLLHKKPIVLKPTGLASRRRPTKEAA